MKCPFVKDGECFGLGKCLRVGNNGDFAALCPSLKNTMVLFTDESVELITRLDADSPVRMVDTEEAERHG